MSWPGWQHTTEERSARELGIPVRVRAGGAGSFTVLVNGEPIYSKKQTGRSPSPAEIVVLTNLDVVDKLRFALLSSVRMRARRLGSIRDSLGIIPRAGCAAS